MTDDLGGSPAAVGGEQLFQALCILQARCRDNAAGLPQYEAQRDVWAGLLFRIGEISLLAPLEEVGEILEVPRDVTLVPGTRGWVFGIANNRGTLLPMFDLRAFLLGVSTKRSGRNRVLVVRREGTPVGLLIGDVTGIRHFKVKSQVRHLPDLPNTLIPFTAGSFTLGERSCPVFSVRQLTLDPKFNLTGV